LDFELAYYLGAFAVPSYGGTNVADYIKKYQSVAHYEFQATDVAAAASWLYGNGAMTKDDVVALLSRMHDDAHVSVGSRLFIERVQYSMGVL
ncbi:MAG TPA: hypothetical protein VF341_10465, partial [Anaeromyxobacteraceae bacterium]